MPSPSTATNAALLNDTAFTHLLVLNALNADVVVATHRRARGAGYTEAGLRNFTATLSVNLPIPDLLEQLGDWGSDDTNPDVPDMLARIHPLLADVALHVRRSKDGLQVRLVKMTGSILNSDHLDGDLYDALAARSDTLESMFCAFTEKDWGVPTLKPSLHVERPAACVTLLSDVTSATELNTVAAGLEAALVSQVLRDVAFGSQAVLTHVGKLRGAGETGDALRQFWTDLSFHKWRHGLWVADTATLAFYEPARML